jgi:purine-nucleoside phosphorylase
VENFAIERVREYGARVALVLGSGLNSLVPDPPRERVIPYSEIGGVPRSLVKGHLSRFVLSEIGDTPVVFAQGRVHLYEGHSAQEVAAGVRFLARAGIERLILTNAAGSVRPDFSPGSWMMIQDITRIITGPTPLLGLPNLSTNRCLFPRWRERFALRRSRKYRAASRRYAGVLGPEYETPAEVKMLRLLGADAIGMSTVCETIQARALGLRLRDFLA